MDVSINRRSFLGGLVAAAALPTIGADDVALFPGRGKYERMAISYRRVHLGLEKPFSILHISDTHLTEAYEHETEKRNYIEIRRRTFGGCQVQSLKDSLEWAKLNVDYVLHTGDLIDFQTEANLDLVKKFFGEAAGMMFGCTGNHDYQRRCKGDVIKPTAEYNNLSNELLSKAYPFDIKLQSTVVNGVNFVAIEQVYGTVTAEQVERFAAEVKKGLPIVLCMHAPFMTPELWRFNCRYWAGVGNHKKFRSAAIPQIGSDYKRQQEDKTTADFVKYLQSEKLLKCILAGHAHIGMEDRFSPTAMEYVVAGNFMPVGEEVLFT